MRAVLLYLLVFGALIYIGYQAVDRAEVSASQPVTERYYRDLNQILKGTYSGPYIPSKDYLFGKLLDREDGASYLEKLDQDYAKILYRKERSQVYFLNRRNESEHYPEFHFLEVYTHESGGWETHSSRAKYPHFLILESLSLKEGQLSITGRIRDPLERETSINGVAVEAGQRVKFHVDASTFRPMPIRLTQLGAPMIL